MLFVTRVTPGTAHAVCCASSRSAQERTLPLRWRTAFSTASRWKFQATSPSSVTWPSFMELPVTP